MNERVELLAQVGRAVHHAHSHLVVHRDLKPSNLLVTAAGEVKLLDFGIAKPLDDGGEAGEPLTREATRVLTPEYASPEQVLGRPVTVASDVYQLGLLLYELLCGQRAQHVDTTAPDTWREAICARPSVRPSGVVRSPATAAVAAARRTTPAALVRALRGELDTIVLMALRKEPERRYASAAQMVEDLERYRERLPLRARPDTLGYRTRTFVRRNPKGFAAAAALGVLLVGYAATVTYQARQLARERDRARVEALKAQRIRDYVVGLFEAADPYRAKGEQVTAAELVDAGARQARERLSGEPEVQADLLEMLGTILNNRAAYDRAEPLLAEVLALRRRTHGADHPDLARAIHAYASVLSERDRNADALELAREGLAMRRRLHGQTHVDVADSLGRVAIVLMLRGEAAESEILLREALDIRRQLAPDAPEVAMLWNVLGVALNKQQKDEEAEAAHREALTRRRALFPLDDPVVSESVNNLAAVLKARGKLAEAEPLYREALEVRRRVFGPTHPRVANTLNNLGTLLLAMGRFDEAAAAHRETLAIRKQALGPRHSNVAISLHNLGAALRDGGRLPEAERRFREALGMFRETLPAGHPSVGSSAFALGRVLVSRGRAREADLLLAEALATRVAKNGESSLKADEVRVALGLCRLAQGRTAEARELLGRARGLKEAGEGDPYLIAEAQAALARLSERRDAP